MIENTGNFHTMFISVMNRSVIKYFEKFLSTEKFQKFVTFLIYISEKFVTNTISLFND